MRRPILNHLKRGELVYEPFLGSGTTLAAAELTERVCCGIELDPKYVDVIVQRWQTLNGKKAKLDGDGRSFEEVAQERKQAKERPRDVPSKGCDILGVGKMIQLDENFDLEAANYRFHNCLKVQRAIV